MSFTNRVEASNEAVVVTQLVFSGRPDPQWTITDPVQKEQLLARLSGTTTVPPPNWPASGCRGFQVLNVDSSFNIPSLVRVFQGVIEVGSSYFADVNHLEEFLASTIPTALDGNGNKVVDVCE